MTLRKNKQMSSAYDISYIYLAGYPRMKIRYCSKTKLCFQGYYENCCIKISTNMNCFLFILCYLSGSLSNSSSVSKIDHLFLKKIESINLYFNKNKVPRESLYTSVKIFEWTFIRAQKGLGISIWSLTRCFCFIFRYRFHDFSELRL